MAIRKGQLDARSERFLREKEAEVRSGGELAERAREASVAWLAKLQDWDIYFTLTYDPRRSGVVVVTEGKGTVPYSRWASARHFRWWCSASEAALSRYVFAVGVQEFQRSGWPHWHGLLAAGGLSSDEFVALSKLWFDRFGFCKFDRVAADDREAIAGYISKYLVKSSSELVLHGSLRSGALAGQLVLPGIKGEA